MTSKCIAVVCCGFLEGRQSCYRVLEGQAELKRRALRTDRDEQVSQNDGETVLHSLWHRVVDVISGRMCLRRLWPLSAIT